MGQHGAPSRVRMDLVALTGLGLLVVALAVAVALSIIVSSPRRESHGQLKTEFVSENATERDPAQIGGAPDDLRQ